jgi:hypothetical protein
MVTGWHSVLATILALLVGTAASVMRQSQQPNRLKIVGPSRMALALDPACNARSGVTVASRLRNDSQTPVDLAPTIGDLVSKTAGKTAMAIASLTLPQEGTGQRELDRRARVTSLTLCSLHAPDEESTT